MEGSTLPLWQRRCGNRADASGWLLLLLAGIGAAACSFLVKKTYQPVYTAFAAYAVSSDSVYAGNKNYEQKVAEQIGIVFPYILTSDVLREKSM